MKKRIYHPLKKAALANLLSNKLSPINKTILTDPYYFRLIAGAIAKTFVESNRK